MSKSRSARGYLSPPVVIILALIVFAVAATLLFNSRLARNIKDELSPNPPVFQSPSTTIKADDIANLKTYKNEDLGFSLIYPRDFILRNGQGEISSVSFLSPNEKETKEGVLTQGGFISIVVRDAITSSLESEVDKIFAGGQVKLRDTKPNFTLDKVQAIKSAYKPMEPAQADDSAIIVVAIYRNKTIVLTSVSVENYRKELSQIF